MPPLLCTCVSITPFYHSTPSHHSQICVWHEPSDRIRGDKIQRWTPNLSLHKCVVFLWWWGLQRDSQKPSQYSPQSPLVPLTDKRLPAGLSAKRSTTLVWKREKKKIIKYSICRASSPICLEILRKFSRTFGLLILRLLVLYFSTAFLTIRISYQ